MVAQKYMTRNTRLYTCVDGVTQSYKRQLVLYFECEICDLIFLTLIIEFVDG